MRHTDKSMWSNRLAHSIWVAVKGFKRVVIEVCVVTNQQHMSDTGPVETAFLVEKLSADRAEITWQAQWFEHRR